jgi:hypothetical protein
MEDGNAALQLEGLVALDVQHRRERARQPPTGRVGGARQHGRHGR